MGPRPHACVLAARSVLDVLCDRLLIQAAPARPLEAAPCAAQLCTPSRFSFDSHVRCFALWQSGELQSTAAPLPARTDRDTQAHADMHARTHARMTHSRMH